MNAVTIPSMQVDVVAVGSHPDDVEMLVGGTLAHLSKKGVTCGIVDLTNAEPTPANEKYRSPDDFDPDYDAKRRDEARRAGEALGVAARVTLDLPNRRVFDNFENRCRLATVFRTWRPRIVMVMYGKTIMASPDHYQTQLITEAAVFYSRLTKWESYFSGTPVHTVSNLLYFPVRETWGLHPEGESGRLTSFFVDITDSIDQKRAAIECYRSQFHDQGKEGFIERVLERNRSFGRQVQVPYAEHLASPVPLMLDDLTLFY